MRLLMELRLTNPRSQAADTDIQSRVRAPELDVRGPAPATAYDAIDQSLDVRQRARFRLFEQEIELRKCSFSPASSSRTARTGRTNQPSR